MMGLQLAFGLVLALVASWQLRPIFRRQDAGATAAYSKTTRVDSARIPGASRTVGWRLWRRPDARAIVPCSGKSFIPAVRRGLRGSSDSC